MWVCENCFEENKNANQVCSGCSTPQGNTMGTGNNPAKRSNAEERLKEGKKLNNEGNYHEAIDAFEDAILANYKTDQAYYGLYVAYNALGRGIEAQEALNRSKPSVYQVSSPSVYQTSTPNTYQPPKVYKNPGTAAVLSFFYMGLGQIYNGEIGKGIAFILVYTVSLFLVLLLIGFITTPFLWIVGMMDAHNSAKRINEEIARS